MTLLFDMLIWAHVATGFVGLGAFWPNCPPAGDHLRDVVVA